MTADPCLGNSERTLYHNLRTEAFQRTPVTSFGMAGVSVLRGRGVNNWDVFVSRRAPLFSETRHIRFRTEMVWRCSADTALTCAASAVTVTRLESWPTSRTNVWRMLCPA